MNILLLLACISWEEPKAIIPGEVISASPDDFNSEWYEVAPPQGSKFTRCYYKKWNQATWGVCE